MKPEKRRVQLILYSLWRSCAFSASVLLVLMTGVRVYRDSVDAIESRFERTCISYVEKSGILTRGSGRTACSGQERRNPLENIEGTHYETVIYVYKGMLMELFHESGLEFSGARRKIVPAGDIDFKWEAENLLYIKYTGTGGVSSGAYLNVLSDGETEGIQ